MRITKGDKPLGLAYPIDRVKLFLRVTGTDEDQVISRLINAAVDIIEHNTSIVLGSRTYTAYMDSWSSFVLLNKFPISSIASIKYYDVSNNIQTLATSSYWSSLNGDHGRIIIDDQPVLFDDRFDAVEIAFVVGYADWHNIPDSYVELLEIIVADLYDNRQTGVIGAASNVVKNSGIANMLRNYDKRLYL